MNEHSGQSFSSSRHIPHACDGQDGPSAIYVAPSFPLWRRAKRGDHDARGFTFRNYNAVSRSRWCGSLGAFRLESDGHEASRDALLGLGACIVDPGASVAPELLRRYAGRFPTAAVWQGAYAGALAHLRVLTDQGGLGRLINKSLLSPHDFGGRPSCDTAFEQLVRWLSPNRPQRLNVRGMSARALLVEVMLGFTCMFALGKSEATGARSDSGRTVERTKATAPRGLPEIDDAVSGL